MTKVGQYLQSAVAAATAVVIGLVIVYVHAAGPVGDINHDGTVNIFDLSILLSHWGETSPSPTPSPSSFIGRSGQNLTLNGQATQFIGFNAYGMTGCYNGSAWTTTQLDAYFASLPANGLTRLWAFQYYGTGPISTILTEAAKYNQHVILTLGDDDSHCNDSQDALGGDGSGKTLAFYQTDWKGAYLTWVNTIVPMFRNNPTIAMWEIANEPFHAGAGAPSLQIQEDYINGAAAAIKADDPNHLVDIGANAPQDFGGASNFGAAQSGPDIDIISFHDYAWDYEGKAVNSGNFTTAKSAAQQYGKAFMASEAGVESGSQCTASTGLSQSDRQSYLAQKWSNYKNGNISALIYWEYEPFSPGVTCSYEIFPGDPMLTFVAGQ